MKIWSIIFVLLVNGCSSSRVGCTEMYHGEQVELIKYEGKGIYKCKPLSDTTWTLHIHEADLQ